MSVLDRVRNFFRSGTSGFNEFEKCMLASVLNELPSERQREKFQHRIDAINLVQRLDGGREINCYAMHGGSATFDEGTRLDQALMGEQLLAELKVMGPLGTQNTGKIWLVDGNLFSIEFTDPTEHADATMISAVSVRFSPAFLQRNKGSPLVF